MILSARWIFDHIEADWQSVDLDEIARRFNQVTAEIESVEKYFIDLQPFALAQIQTLADSVIQISIPEWGATHSLPTRTDITKVDSSHGYLVVANGETVRWATLRDWNLDKEGLMPAFQATQSLLAGSWRELVQAEDVLFDVDNKSITHRPDMWGHRGFAREIAAFMDLPFKKESKLITSRDVTYFDGKNAPTPQNPFVIRNEAPSACNQFAGLYCSAASNSPSHLFVASRIMRVGTRTINGLVDLTNYLMLDWSQPSHAYDAQKIVDSTLIVRMAKPGEMLELLGDEQIELTAQDLIIADPQKPLALAGVKGGKHDSITDETRTLFLEAAHFDAGVVRKAAARHHVRTESSARFEKTLDPRQATIGIMRFLFLAEQFGSDLTPQGPIVCVGREPQDSTITVSHEFLVRRSGIAFTCEQVVAILEKLGFGVEGNGDDYCVTVPTFRGTKDVTIKEDILEEVVRSYGFEHIPHEVPELRKTARDLNPLFRMRKLKAHLAFAAGMTEQQNYSLYHQPFLDQLGYKPRQTPKLLNPVSTDETNMVSSLIPHLLKNIESNRHDQDTLNYFEVGRVWSVSEDQPMEQGAVAGVWFEKRTTVDFYACKQKLQSLFDLLGCDVSWEKSQEQLDDWFNPHQTAQLVYQGNVIGYAGTMRRAMLGKLDVLPESTAFLFEFDTDAVHGTRDLARYTPAGKFQRTTFDLSFMMPLKVTVADVQSKLSTLNQLITKVSLVDFFEKEEWLSERSIAFRFWLEHPSKTLTKEEIETVRLAAIKTLQNFGGTLRDY